MAVFLANSNDDKQYCLSTKNEGFLRNGTNVVLEDCGNLGLTPFFEEGINSNEVRLISNMDNNTCVNYDINTKQTSKGSCGSNSNFKLMKQPTENNVMNMSDVQFDIYIRDTENNDEKLTIKKYENCKAFTEVYVGPSQGNKSVSIELWTENLRVFDTPINSDKTFKVYTKGNILTVETTDGTSWNEELKFRACFINQNPGYNYLGCYKSSETETIKKERTVLEHYKKNVCKWRHEPVTTYKKVCTKKKKKRWWRKSKCVKYKTVATTKKRWRYGCKKMNKTRTKTETYNVQETTNDMDTSTTINDSPNLLGECKDTCQGKGYKYFGVENGDTCWCGDDFGSLGQNSASLTCSTPCIGTAGQLCGSSDSNSVYEITNSDKNGIIQYYDGTCGITSSKNVNNRKELYQKYLGYNFDNNKDLFTLKNGGSGVITDDIPCSDVDVNSKILIDKKSGVSYYVQENLPEIETKIDTAYFTFEPEENSSQFSNFFHENSDFKSKIVYNVPQSDKLYKFYLFSDGKKIELREWSNNTAGFSFDIVKIGMEKNSSGELIENTSSVQIKDRSGKYLFYNSESERIELYNSSMDEDPGFIMIPKNVDDKFKFLKNNYDEQNNNFNISTYANPNSSLTFSSNKLLTGPTNNATKITISQTGIEGFENINTNAVDPNKSNFRNFQEDIKSLFKKLENLNVNSSLEELSEIQETIKISNYEITPILDQNQLGEIMNVYNYAKLIETEVSSIYNEMKKIRWTPNHSIANTIGVFHSSVNSYNYNTVVNSIGIIKQNINKIKSVADYVNGFYKDLNIDVSTYFIDVNVLYLVNNVLKILHDDGNRNNDMSVFFDYFNIKDNSNASNRLYNINSNVYKNHYIGNETDYLTSSKIQQKIDELVPFVNNYYQNYSSKVMRYMNYDFDSLIINRLFKNVNSDSRINYNNIITGPPKSIPYLKIFYDPSISISPSSAINSYIKCHMNYLYTHKIYSDVNKELYNIKTEADVLINSINTNITFNWLKNNFYDNFYNSTGSNYRKYINNYKNALIGETTIPTIELIKKYSTGNLSDKAKLCNIRAALLTSSYKNMSDVIKNSINDNSKYPNLSHYYFNADIISNYINTELFMKLTAVLNNPSVCGETQTLGTIINMKEGFTGKIKEGFYTSGNLNIYDGKETNYTAFLNKLSYKENSNDYDSASDLLEKGRGLDIKTDNNVIQCNTEGAGYQPINFDMNYTCSNSDIINIKDVNTGGEFLLNDSCKTNTSDKECLFTVKLEYNVNENDIIEEITLNFYDINNNNKQSETYLVNSGEGVFKDLLVPFYKGNETSGVRTEIKNTEDNLLFNLTNDEKQNALYTDDYKFRLVLIDGKVSIQCKTSFCSTFTDSDSGEMHGIYNDYVYANRLNKNYYSKNIGNSGYIDNTGMLHISRNENPNENHISINNIEYKKYTGFKIIDISKLTMKNSDNLDSAKLQAKDNKDIIGIYTDGIGFFGLKKENIKDLMIDTNGNDIVYIKRDSIKNIDKSCVSLARDSKMISSREWQAYQDNGKTTDMTSSLYCGMDLYLGESKKNVDNDFSSMEKSFNEFKKLYDELTNTEIELLNKSKSDIYEMEEMVREYDEIYQTAYKNKLVSHTVAARVEETKVDHAREEFFFALGGIATIASVLFLIKTIKR
jgi:hypothetical protein